MREKDVEIHLGADPGSANFSISVIKYKPSTQQKKILYVGMIANPIKNLTATPVRDKKRRGKSTLPRDEPSFEVGMQLFTDEIEWLYKTFKITHTSAERFQVRGQFKGDTIESINIMMGILFTVARRHKSKINTTTAGVWKNAIARLGGDLFTAYEDAKILYKLQPHPIDSTLIALWHANKGILWLTPNLLRFISARLRENAK